MTIDLDAAIKTLEAHTPNDVICKKADLLGLIQRLREAEKDAEKWSYCVEHGFPVRNQNAQYVDRYWIVTSKTLALTYGSSPDEAVDAAIDQQRKIATGEDLGL